ncbi:transposase [Ruegeria jejuensis]|uniref:transposase n=1 Tax=Ruegeria jejuensis TaxID=3233338 RepID=UPI00355C5146
MDGAYDTRRCHDAIATRNAHAIIPPRKNAKPWKPTSAGAIARNEAVNASRYLGRAIWRKWSGYHRRSRVETKMHCVKRCCHLWTAPILQEFSCRLRSFS